MNRIDEGLGRNDFRQRWASLFTELQQEWVDVLSGRLTAKEIRARQRDSAKKLKALEQELSRRRQVQKP
jgi:hypothetical protein